MVRMGLVWFERNKLTYLCPLLPPIMGHHKYSEKPIPILTKFSQKVTMGRATI
jgi:hypothetical protein